jgi:hypothetical protein
MSYYLYVKSYWAVHAIKARKDLASRIVAYVLSSKLVINYREQQVSLYIQPNGYFRQTCTSIPYKR